MADEADRRRREQVFYAFIGRIPLAFYAVGIMFGAGIVTLWLWTLAGLRPGVILPFLIVFMAYGWGVEAERRRGLRARAQEAALADRGRGESY